MSRIFPNDEDRALLLRKGVYPYQYIGNWEVLEETELPPRDAFNSDLTEEPITEGDYAHAKKVWNHFGIKNLMGYTRLYLTSDIILLADLFQNYRKLSLQQYGIDPAWHYTSPGFFWEAMLKMTGVKLEIIKDIDMLQFIESGIRGGITNCIKRHAIANNPLIPERYDSQKPHNFIMYVDVNNLYGWSMSNPLPYGGFQWVEDVSSLDLLNLPPNGELGWIYDVDISYPASLHDAHSNLPFFPESMKPPGSRVNKLLTTLYDKTHYVTHFVNLQQGIKAGLIISKIHRVLQFKQSKWLEPYMNYNTNLRAQSSSAFDKDYYKLANNSVFGRSMMNKRNFKDFKLVTTEEKLMKYVNQPNFNDRFIFAENLIGVHMDRKRVLFDMPIYVGFAILELSKSWMCHLFYDRLRPSLGGRENVDLCYMDTDAFILDIKVPNTASDIYDELQKLLPDLMDFSDYPSTHKCFSSVNKKVVGKLKDETLSIPIAEFAGLRAKLYGIKFGSKSIIKAKGVKKVSVKKNIKFQDFLDTLSNQNLVYCNFHKISSKLHRVATTEHRKVALSFFDDKRQILEDRVHTLPHGYNGGKEYTLFKAPSENM
uniref:DNA-directed DNA polymerase n=1 Tax=Lygus hesperus TaxID=30085 RepID=A0A0K8SU06_LYGHE